MRPGRVRRWVRRRQRARENASDLFETVYTLVLLAAMVGYMIWAQLQAVLSGQTSAPAGVREGVLLAAGLAWTAALLAVASALGPVSTSAPALQWLVTAPLDRRALLTPAVAQVTGIGLLAGLAQGLLTLTLSTVGAGAVLLAAVAGGVLVLGAAAAVQSASRRPARRLSTAATVLAIAAAVVGVLAVTGVDVAAVATTGPWGWPLLAGRHPWLAMVIAAVALLMPILQWYRLRWLTLANLTDAAQSSGAATAVFFTLDPGLASRAAEDRRWRGRRLGPDRLPRVAGRFVATGQDALLLLRSPVRLLLAAALVTVPVLAAGLPVSRWVIAAAWLLCALAAASCSTANARRDRDDPGLARLLGLTDGELFTGRVAVPVAVCTLWSAAALSAVGGGFGPWTLLGALAGLGLAAAALRSARRREVRHDAAALSSPAGFMPTGPFLWLAGAADLAVLALWPTLLAIVTRHPDTALFNQVVFSAGTLSGMIINARRG
ncbi:DUF6297 family protein [Dactylosporangium matsuzakiense]|uniref:Uncharacterized protein n=1 Tax=Dactylosporangium matsuzakiense TaxID=53360 RepID=A0A9W6KS82_9ACTN|nr:DUF6297 family protein [Dactylosporangium matsuzakiense]GLL05465.1 hypothetical protein GCM10017581_072120 [Dactylosporangium matsuzakiense]